MQKHDHHESTVGLLVASTCTRTAELLGLAGAGVANQQGAVVREQDVLDLLLGSLIDVCTTKRDRSQTIKQ